MPKTSAGLLMYRKGQNGLEFLLLHQGGPFYAKKDEGVWTIPKGECEKGENLLEAAKREFEEETGMKAPSINFLELGSIVMKSGKKVHVWAFEGGFDIEKFKSNTFTMEWPPHSGKQQEFPENDRAEFFSYEEAIKKIHPVQISFLKRLRENGSK